MSTGIAMPRGRATGAGIALAFVSGSVALGATSVLYPTLGYGGIGVELALLLVVVVWRRPALGLMGLILFIPIYQLLFAKLYISGIPAQVLQPLRFWKELIVAVLALKLLHDGWGELDLTDVAALAFLAVIGIYVVAPIGPPIGTKILAAREDGLFVIIFLVARHLRCPEWLPMRLEVVILAYGVVIGGFAFLNHFAPDSWVNFANNTGIDRYRREVLHVFYDPPSNVGISYDTLGGHPFIRAGSLSFNPVLLAFSSLLPIGIVMGRAAGHGRRLWEVGAGFLWVSALILSLTRSAIFTLPIMLLVVVWARGLRARLAVGILVGVIVLFPLASAIGLAPRLTSAFDTSTGTAGVHIGALRADWERVIAHPIGTGLGTGSLQGQRAATPGYTDTESWYFEIGVDAGLLGMILYIWWQALVMRGLWRRARSGQSFSAGVLAGLAGLAVGGIFLPSLADLGVSWSIFMLAGLALAARATVPEPRSEPQRATPVGLGRASAAGLS